VSENYNVNTYEATWNQHPNTEQQWYVERWRNHFVSLLRLCGPENFCRYYHSVGTPRRKKTVHVVLLQYYNNTYTLYRYKLNDRPDRLWSLRLCELYNMYNIQRLTISYLRVIRLVCVCWPNIIHYNCYILDGMKKKMYGIPSVNNKLL
jgi:hypothetical protein